MDFSQLGPLDDDWKKRLAEEFQKPYMKNLRDFVAQERSQSDEIYPPRELVFNALNKTSFSSVKVCLLGQDPYHGPGQAHGLCFSVPRGVPQPPSLKNIFKELQQDVGIAYPGHGCLEFWAEQGVLLLNATLTVKKSKPLSHHKRGWEQFTDAVITLLCNREDPVIFVLWGKSAQDKINRIANCNHHFFLTAPHPSPLSAYHGFLGCRHFSKVNQLLLRNGKAPIDWQI